jgi:glutathione synthase/RimK-type ligase-like ATP-grasp enzyme
MKNILIGIQPDLIGEESYSEKWSEFVRQRGAETLILDLLASDALDQARRCDGVMWRWAHTPKDKQSAQRILYSIEHYLRIPVFPNSKTAWHYDEKVAQNYLLKLLDAPVPRSWLFWDWNQAMAWVNEAPYPLVFKLSCGASSSNVLKVESKAEAIALINQSFHRGIFPSTMNQFRIPSGLPRNVKQARMLVWRVGDGLRYIWRGEYPRLHPLWWKPEYGYVYFQEFLPDNSYDTRITVIGNRAFGYRRLNRANDFRASGSGNFVVDPEAIDRRCIEIAFQISRRGKFQSMAYDFLFKEGQPVISEISYTFVDWMVHSCPGHWDSHLNWLEGQMWPQEAQAEDFLYEIQRRKAL